MKYDLTKYFNEILLEKNDDNFIPDLLLLNLKTHEKIYIEIAVTHFSSESKKNSGHRIMEFTLTSDKDVQKIIDFKNIGSSNIVNYYNFKKKQNTSEFCTKGNCIRKFNFFTVAIDGKCNLNIIKENEFQKTFDKYKSNSIWNIFEPADQLSEEELCYSIDRSSDTFIKYVASAYQKNVKVKNCFICRYHAQNTSWDFVKGEPIFCKFRKITCSSDNAANCQYYKAELSYVNKYLQSSFDESEIE